jgi:branched-chain amino acid aminotransferase
MTTKSIWMDGELVSWDDATVHVTTFGLHYGIGFFEGIRCHSAVGGPAIFRLSDHLNRLRRSAAIYGVELPYSTSELAAACRLVVTANHLADCYLRPIVFLGDGTDPLAAKFRAAVIATDNGPLAPPAANQGLPARISSFSRISTSSVPPAAKATGQYLNSFLAQVEAIRSGCAESILLNSNGFVTDGWAHNVFVVTGETIRTPPVSAGALPGITRDTIMVLAREAGFTACEQDLVRTDLYLADECFLTGTAAGVVPLASVDGRRIGTGQPGPVTAKLKQGLADVVTGASAAHPQWREQVG